MGIQSHPTRPTWVEALERMIGVARRILDYLLMQNTSRPLSNEVLYTFMAEITALINVRPLVPISADSDSPLILTPAMLLTQMLEHLLLQGTFQRVTCLDNSGNRCRDMPMIFGIAGGTNTFRLCRLVVNGMQLSPTYKKETLYCWETLRQFEMNGP